MSDTREHIITRGLKAKALLEHETLLECFEDLFESTFTQFLSSESNDFDVREKLWDLGKALQLVKAKLEGYVADGRMEEVNKKHDENI